MPALLRNEDSLTSIIGTPTALVAVPDSGRAYFIAGLAALTAARPLLVVVPTASDVERIANDLRLWMGSECVDVFPAWETLPFERVSPAIETMGRRMRAMWHLHNPRDNQPHVIVAPVKALVQRLGPHVEEIEPVMIRRGDVVDTADLVNRWPTWVIDVTTKLKRAATSLCAAQSSTSSRLRPRRLCASTYGVTK